MYVAEVFPDVIEGPEHGYCFPSAPYMHREGPVYASCQERNTGDLIHDFKGIIHAS
jgi:hypothetical protein